MIDVQNIGNRPFLLEDDLGVEVFAILGFSSSYSSFIYICYYRLSLRIVEIGIVVSGDESKSEEEGSSMRGEGEGCAAEILCGLRWDVAVGEEGGGGLDEPPGRHCRPALLLLELSRPREPRVHVPQLARIGGFSLSLELFGSPRPQVRCGNCGLIGLTLRQPPEAPIPGDGGRRCCDEFAGERPT